MRKRKNGCFMRLNTIPVSSRATESNLMGKVAKSARQIMSTLWGPKGRPETNEYAERCARQYLGRYRPSSLMVREVVKPREAASAPQSKQPRRAESQRTTDKWAAARAAQR